MALLLSVLIAVLAAGSVVAATGGFTIWQGSCDITVDESVHIYSGPDTENCNTEVGLNDPFGASIGVWPGECKSTWFRITNDSPSDLLIKAVVASDESVVTVTFNSSDIAGSGLVLPGGGLAFVQRLVCVDGTATPGVYSITTEFTRESPPAP